MGRKGDLKKGYKDYLKSARILEKSGRYKSAVDIYFKAMVSLIDYIVLSELNRLPKNHTERFRITENNFNEIYTVLDSVFSTYRKAYTRQRGEKHVKEIKNGICRIIRTQGIGEEFKTPN